MEGLAARAHKPLRVHGTVTDTEASNWKHKDMKDGRVVCGKEWRDLEVRK